MTCTGCSGAVDRVLSKTKGTPASPYPCLPSLTFDHSPPFSLSLSHPQSTLKSTSLNPTAETGLTSYTVDFPSKTADVYTASEEDKGISYEDVLKRIKGTGKEVVKGWKDGVEMAV